MNGRAGSVLFLAVTTATALALHAGCATSTGGSAAAAPTSEPAAKPKKKVAVGRALPSGACRALGRIEGTAKGGDWASADAKEDDSYGQLRSATLNLGGDYALIESVVNDDRRVTVRGAAYDCSGAPPTQTAAGASAPAPPPKFVQVGRALPHAGCRDLGLIWGTGKGWWPSAEERMQDAYAELMSSTRALGGDYALIDALAGTHRDISISGHAYDCSHPPPPAEAAAPAKPAETAEERLGRLDQLKAKGLITPEEYATKRRAILDGL